MNTEKEIKEILFQEYSRIRSQLQKPVSRDHYQIYSAVAISFKKLKKVFGNYSNFKIYCEEKLGYGNPFQNFGGEKDSNKNFTHTSDSAKAEFFGDTGVAESKSPRIKTLEDLIEACHIDLDEWEVERHIINKWEVGAKDKNQNIAINPLFQVKAFLKKRKKSEIKELINFFREQTHNLNTSRGFQIITNRKENMLAYEVSIPDLHLSKLCWGEETGGSDYDIKKAVSRYESAFQDLIEKVIDNKDVSKIILPVGNDFFNSEGLSKATTKGTPQDEDSRWPKSFKVGCELITSCIDSIAPYFPVEVVTVLGNHDHERSFYLGEYLNAWYRNCKDRVTIDNAPRGMKYITFGDNLICFTHGNDIKHADIPLVMATQYPNFSNYKHKRVHLGHLHQDWLREYKGVKVRVLPSLCPPDFWHSSKGFIGNNEAAIGILYDFTEGEIANFYHNVKR